MVFVLNRSDDGRLRTQEYFKCGKRMFAIAEQTEKGSLITEFNLSNEVANQVYLEGGNAQADVIGYLDISGSSVRVDGAGKYSGVSIDARCSGCGAGSLFRELDGLLPSEIKDIPVVPIFMCKECKKKHYMLTDSYLAELVKNNDALFEKSERDEISSNLDSSINMLQEYIIRIFASKKISRIETGRYNDREHI